MTDDNEKRDLFTCAFSQKHSLTSRLASSYIARATRETFPVSHHLVKAYSSRLHTMLKPSEKINWKDSNLALFGSELEKNIKKAAAGRETAWDGLGKEATLKVWRIEKFLVKVWPKRKYGSFHKGDSYIVLHSYQKDPNRPKLSHDIHIWIGDESSQDEYGTAAYKMVELDDFLGGAAVQHRETQGRESRLFSGYFQNKLKYLEGGIESGFRHVGDEKDDPHLYHIKGHSKTNTLRMTQEPLRRDALNSGDVFVLVVSEEKVYLWNGKESNKDEKSKGVEVARDFCEKGTVTVLDQGVNDGKTDAKVFWSYIPDKVSVIGPIKRTVTVQDSDDLDDKGHAYVPTLYKIPAIVGNRLTKAARASMVPTGPTKKEQPKIDRSYLHENSAYLLDTGYHAYIWLGRKSSPEVRSKAILHGHSYFTSFKRPILPLSVVKSKQEPSGFNQYFVEGASTGCQCTVM